MPNALLTVIIPTYRRPFEVVRGALESLRAQTYAPIDILIVDDNRDDDGRYTRDLKAGLAAYPDVGYTQTQGGHGAQYARNTGIGLAKGTYLAFLDDDDSWMPTLAEREIALLEAHPQAGMAYCMGTTVDMNTDPPTETPYCLPENFRTSVTFDDQLLQDHIGTTTQAILRADALRDVGPFDVAFVARQDYEMWLRISRKYACVGVPETLFLHTLHAGEQISKGNTRALRGLRAIYDKYERDFARNFAAQRKIAKQLAALYRNESMPAEAAAFDRIAQKALVRGALKILRQPGKWVRVIRDRIER